MEECIHSVECGCGRWYRPIMALLMRQSWKLFLPAISGSFKSYLGFYTRGKWSTTSDSNGNFNGFEPFLSASWSSGRYKPQKEGERSHTSHMLFRGSVFFLPHISLRLQNTKGQLSLVALVEFESTLNGF